MTESSIPTLIDYSDDYKPIIFQQKKKAIVLFRSEEEKESDYAKVFE